MKRLLCLFLSLFVFPAFAVTSELYVDSAVDALQNEIPAENTNAVLTNTGIAGEIGTKKIYDETQSFATQTDALVTAETFNAAVQNAIDNEFVCIEWLGEHVPGNCLLWQLQNTTPQQIIPNEYTQLEYIESTGTQYIDTKIKATDFTETKVVGQYTELAENDTIFGVMAANGLYYYGLGLANGTNWRLWYGRGPAPWVIFGTSDTNKHTFILKNKSIYFDNNTTPAAISELSTPSQSRNLLLFGTYWGEIVTYLAKVKIYSAIIYDNDVLVHNFIPARRNSDNVLGMYDTVTGTFFTNAGTGEFIAGPDVVSNLYLPSGN